MKDKVRLKSYTKGIKIVIDEDAEMDEILTEIADKFKDSERFFGKAKLAVTFEGRENTIDEENAILDKIKEISTVNIVCVVSSQSNEAFERAIQSVEQILSEDTAQFYRGDLTDKAALETEQSIIVLGNIKKGSSVISKKDIIILGDLEGSAYAGVDGNPHFIAALSMNPETVRIGDLKGKTKGKSLWGRKKQMAPQIAYIKDKEIVFENLEFTEELLQTLS